MYSQELMVEERGPLQMICQRNSIRYVNMYTLAEQGNVMMKTIEYNILQITEFAEITTLTYTESFVEALYCVRYSAVPLYY